MLCSSRFTTCPVPAEPCSLLSDKAEKQASIKADQCIFHANTSIIVAWGVSGLIYIAIESWWNLCLVTVYVEASFSQLQSHMYVMEQWHVHNIMYYVYIIEWLAFNLWRLTNVFIQLGEDNQVYNNSLGNLYLSHMIILLQLQQVTILPTYIGTKKAVRDTIQMVTG